jgi:pimeloyl-ACP methyl ester carboxylesterase
MQTQQVQLQVDGRALDIEYAWVGAPAATGPVWVFLHEGLGSVAMWKEFPAQLCQALGVRGLVYSRPGYGRSTPRAHGERWAVDFMHRQAQQVLPALLQALQVPAPYTLFGHSDGGSIALLHAAFAPERVQAVVAMAPHILVEDISLRSIRLAREQYEDKTAGGLRERLARFHADVDSAFYGWNDIWLDTGFARWNIALALKHIHAPVLALQGENDAYGTMAQIDGIAQQVPDTQLIKLAACGHSPHRDQPEHVIKACLAFNAHLSPLETTR